MGNRLSGIVTRAGDAGMTSLSDGSRIDKDAPRMEAIGTIDELDSHIGFARCLIAAARDTAPLHEMVHEFLNDALGMVQRDLVDLGDALSHPGAELLRPAHVEQLDSILAQMNALPPLEEHAIQTGRPVVAGALDIARTVARRAERRLLSALAEDPQPAASSLAYLNQLGDVLLIAARTAGGLGKTP